MANTATDPCLGCGPINSTPYLQCTYSGQGGNASALPACANQKGSTNVIQDTIGNATQGVQSAATNAVSGLISSFTSSLFPALERIGLFIFAMILVIVGVIIVAQ